ncbi:hypothetical protein H4V99_002956 [Cryobacterium sp. CG_9.6]|nr:hypothetical protein [Cryobacterium sp. CG_9.6]
MTGYRIWTNHAGGYNVCSHSPCIKRADWQISDHDCCGRCGQGRLHLKEAMNSYSGPGAFPHKYWESLPGACATCGLVKDVH